MAPPARCTLCGDTRRLTPDGICVWSGGCEHRRAVEAARLAELDQFLATRPAGPLDVGRGMDPRLVDLAHEAMVRLSAEARNLGLIGPDEEFQFDLTDLLTYRRSDD